MNITCNFLYCNYQVHRDFMITLYTTNKRKTKIIEGTNLEVKYLTKCQFPETGNCEPTFRPFTATLRSLLEITSSTVAVR